MRYHWIQGPLIVTLVLSLLGIIFLFVPFHTNLSVRDENSSPIRAIAGVELYEDIRFPANSIHQRVSFDFISSNEHFSAILITNQGLMNRSQGRPFNVIFEHSNITLLSCVLSFDSPISSSILLILVSYHTELDVQGGIIIDCDVFQYDWSMAAFGLGALPIVYVVVNRLNRERLRYGYGFDYLSRTSQGGGLSPLSRAFDSIGADQNQ